MSFLKVVNRYGKVKVILTVVLVLFSINTYFTLAAKLKLPPSNLGLVGYWPMDEGNGSLAKDSSGNSNNGTLVSSPTWTTGKLGNALNFNGSNYVEFNNSTSLSVSGNQITVSVWVKPTAGDYRTILSKGYSSSDGGYAIRMARDSEPTKAFFQVYNTSGTIGSAGTYNNISNGVWSHLIGTYDGSQVCFYVNGVLDGSCGSLTGNIKTNSLPVRLGKLSTAGGTTEFYVGSIDNVHVYNRAISSTEIKQLYQAGTAKMNTSSVNKNTNGLVGYWTFDGADTSTTTATDKSGSGNNGTLVSSPSLVSGKLGQAILTTLGGSVSINSSSSLNIPGNFSVSIWLKPKSSFVGYAAHPINKWTSTTDANYVLYYFGTTSGADKRVMFYANAGGVWQGISGGYILPLNQWTHVAISYNTVTGGQLYINGATYGGLSGSGALATSTAAVNIGTSFPGSIDDTRIYSRALSATEIKQLYNAGVGTQVNSAQVNTPSSSIATGLVGYWPFNGIDVSTTTAFDRSSSGNNGTLTNGPTVAIGKMGQGLKLDGVDDYVIASGNLGISGNSVFSMCAWVKWTSGSWSANFPSFMGNNSTGVGNQGLSFTISNGRPAIDFWNNRWRASSALSVNTWYHLCGVKTAGTISTTSSIYVNGQLVSGAVEGSDGIPNITNSPMVVGRLDATRWFNGIVDDARVYNRALSVAEIKQLYLLGN